MEWLNKIHHGEALKILKEMPSDFVDTVVTSPPYWGLRDYSEQAVTVWGGDEDCEHEFVSKDGDKQDFCSKCGAWKGQLGLEPHPSMYIKHLVEIFHEMKRVLKPTGSFYLNLGDTYGGSGGGRGGDIEKCKESTLVPKEKGVSNRLNYDNGWLQPKQLMLIPSRVAISLQDDGWVLRNDIIWCLSGTTKVYAKTQKQEAPMMIKDIARLKPETVSLWDGEKWNQVKNFHLNKNSTSKMQITLRSGEVIGCTGEHRWLTKTGLKKASTLLIGDSLEKTLLPEPDEPISPSCLHDDIGWFVGVYLAEGSFGKDGNVIQISSHIKNIDRYNKLCKVADSYHGTCRMHHTGGKSATINLYGNVLISIIKHYIYGGDAKTKGITPRCWARSNSFLNSLLFGYLECDGHYDKKNNRYRLGFTRNYRLADDLRTICARLGYNFKLQKSIAKIGDESFKSFKGEIRIKSSNHQNTKKDGEIVSIQKSKSKKFYDIELIDEPHIFALASGILTHNSKPNPMPSSVKDRLNNTFEHVFHFVKAKKYYYDLDAIRVPYKPLNRWGGNLMKMPNKTKVLDGEQPYAVQYRERLCQPNILGKNPSDFTDTWKGNNRKYKVNHNFFSVIDNEKKAYWLGFLFADGNVDKKTNRITLGLAQKDVSHLLAFKESIQSDNPFEYRVYNGSPCIFFRFSSVQIKKDLLRLELKTNKTFDAIDSRLIHHFIRGLLDGDGWVRYRLASNGVSTDYEVGFVNKDKKVVERVRSILKKVSCSNTKYMREYKGGFDFSIGGRRQVEKIGNWLYNNANIYLDRKRLCFPQFINYEQDVWNITTQPFKGAHFAVFPKKLVEQPLKASCPLKVCSKCGKPMVMKKEKVLNIQQKDRQEYKASKNPERDISIINTAPRMNQIERYRNLGYVPSCDCNVEFVPGTVLDPFAGSGTTCVVAKDMRLSYIGIETNTDYIKMALKRLSDTLVSKKLGDV